MIDKRKSETRKKTLFFGLVAALLVASPAMADGLLVKFKGGIGVLDAVIDPTTMAVVPNIVRGVEPGLNPWVISTLSARVTVGGEIHVSGTGLLLAGGDAIGTTGGDSVIATLSCGPSPDGPFTTSSTSAADAVELDADGDFSLDGMLSPPPPNPCHNPVLLIRSAANIMRWFAAGIPVARLKD